MEVVTMEKKAFDLMMARYDALVKKVDLLKHKANGKRLNKWLTGHEVCQQLRISQRTLQKLRDRRFLGHTQIGRQFYYCPEEVKAIVPFITIIIGYSCFTCSAWQSLRFTTLLINHCLNNKAWYVSI